MQAKWIKPRKFSAWYLAGHEAPGIEEPGKEALHAPAAAVAPEWVSVLGGDPPIGSVRSGENDVALLQQFRRAPTAGKRRWHVSYGGNPAEGAPGSDSIVDWVQMRAWKYYDNPPLSPPGGFIEPIAGDPNAALELEGILQDEVNEVLGSPTRVFSDDGVLFSDPSLIGDTLDTINRGTSENNWTVATQTGFSLRWPDLRIDGPVADEDSDEIFFSSTHLFFATAVHEARHSWQWSLVTRSGSAYVDYQADDGLPLRNPSNNNDFYYYDASGVVLRDEDGEIIVDCLPQRAVLLNGRDIGGSFGSAGGIIDSAGNREFSALIHGEQPLYPLLVDSCDALDGPPATARERDALRFERALDQ